MGQLIHLPTRAQSPKFDGEDARRSRLGEVVRLARGTLTQAELANRLGMKQPAISGWESGRVPLGVEQVWRIETVLDLPHGWITVASGLTAPDVEPLAVLLEASVRCGN